VAAQQVDVREDAAQRALAPAQLRALFGWQRVSVN
jgi:hypothetical protein